MDFSSIGSGFLFNIIIITALEHMDCMDKFLASQGMLGGVNGVVLT